MKLQFHHLMTDRRTSHVMISSGRVGSWTKSIFPMPNSDPVQNYSLNFRNQEEENLAWDSPRLASQEAGAVHVTSPTSIKETCADTLSISPSQASFNTQRTIPTTERKWKAIPANSSYGGALSTAVSKMVTRMVLNDTLTQHFTGTR